MVHFDAHLDTWIAYPGQSTEQSRTTHGTFFHVAHQEGLISNASIHAGIRCKLKVYRTFLPMYYPITETFHQGFSDIENDRTVGFQLISADDIDDLGVPEIIRRIRERVGNSPAYLR